MDREKFLAALTAEDREALEKVFDKAAAAEKSGRVMFTQFLSEREYGEFLNREKYIGETFRSAGGGYEGAARVMLAFSSVADEEIYFPIKAVRTTGRGIERLKHPDFLGSVLSLGIERCRVGDILVRGEDAVLFAEEKTAKYVAQSLTAVGGVSVRSEITEPCELHVEARFEEVTGTVASLRADSVVSVMLSTSRSKAAEMIENQMFFLNQRLCVKCDREIKEGDIISVRRHGKGIVASTSGLSKKGRIYVTIKKYI